MSAAKLSLTAELLLLALDPANGGLFPRRRRRFRKALAVGYLADRGGGRRWPWVASRARRDALRELEHEGIIERRSPFARPRFGDRTVAAKRFQRLRRCVCEDEPSEPRDRELLVLLAWSGVLAERLSTSERRLAARRLRKLGVAPQQAAIVPLAGSVAAVACADLLSAGFAPLGGAGAGGGGGGAGSGDGGGCGGGGGC